MKNIMFIAPPAAGKGTQAELVVEKYGIPHISTGDILREISKEDSEIGNYVKETLASGGLVKDDITYQLIEDRLKKDDCKNGYIIDGFPRNIDQAYEYDKILAKLGYTVYNFYSGYNISFDNPKETTLVETKYLTATTANEISEIIRKNITLSFLSKMRKEGRNYVIISADSRTHRILDELCLDYDIETFRSTSHQYYTFIDLRNFSFC